MNILETIVAWKKKELAQTKANVPVAELEKAPGYARNCQSLKASLERAESSGIIAEFKRRSPSKGNINATATVERVIPAYALHGATGLSVLTDHHFFGGGNADLQVARSVSDLPILRKEFIIDPYQVVEAKAIGADVVLLIAECLNQKEVAALAKQATSLGLEVLLEMHSQEQLHKLCPEVTMVGINNRDLTTFSVDIDRSIALARKLPDAMPKIAESGINDPAVIHQMKQAGFDGFLIGEHFMKQKDPGVAFQQFIAQVRTLAEKPAKNA